MVNPGMNAQPIAHGRDLTERDTGLRHTKRTGIHPEKQHALAAISVTPQIHLMGAPGVDQWIVNVCDRRSEAHFGNSMAQTFRRDD
jgi:hypothetical protein